MAVEVAMEVAVAVEVELVAVAVAVEVAGIRSHHKGRRHEICLLWTWFYKASQHRDLLNPKLERPL